MPVRAASSVRLNSRCARNSLSLSANPSALALRDFPGETFLVTAFTATNLHDAVDSYMRHLLLSEHIHCRGGGGWLRQQRCGRRMNDESAAFRDSG
jgi:hypothetical protein